LIASTQKKNNNINISNFFGKLDYIKKIYWFHKEEGIKMNFVTFYFVKKIRKKVEEFLGNIETTSNKYLRFFSLKT
jgi:hypothetical protein